MLIVRLTGDIGTGVRPCVRICWTAAEYLTLLDLIYINGWLYIYLFHSSVLYLFNDYVELRSSSLTFGNASELSFLSFNHDLVTIHDIQSLLGGLAGKRSAVAV